MNTKGKTAVPPPTHTNNNNENNNHNDGKNNNHSSSSSSIPPQQLCRYDVQGTIFEVYSKYELLHRIGQGAYGIVCSGRNLETREMVAIKKVFGVFEHSKDFQKRILREIKILKHLKHKNIISLKDLIMPKSFDTFEDVYIVTDLMETDLRQIIKSGQELTEQHIKYFIYQILCALKCMHSANILHRDLKPCNLLLNSDCELKVCDFGLSRGVNFDLPDPTMSTSYVATRWYRAPELLLQWHEATKAIDMWSVGCIMGELLNKKVLFPGKNYLNQIDLILDALGTPLSEDDIKGSEKARAYMRQLPFRRGKPLRTLFPTASDLALDLLSRMLQFNPLKRITVEEALAHPFLAEFRDLEEEEDEEDLNNNDNGTKEAKKEKAEKVEKFNFDFESDLNSRSIKELLYEAIQEWSQQQQQQHNSSSNNSNGNGDKNNNNNNNNNNKPAASNNSNNDTTAANHRTTTTSASSNHHHVPAPAAPSANPSLISRLSAAAAVIQSTASASNNNNNNTSCSARSTTTTTASTTNSKNSSSEPSSTTKQNYSSHHHHHQQQRQQQKRSLEMLV